MDFKRIRGKISFICAILAAIIFLLFITLKPEDSEEYTYTIKCIFKYGFYPLLFIAITLNTVLVPLLRKMVKSPLLWGGIGLLGIACICVPLFARPAGEYTWVENCWLSGFWVCGSFCLAFSLVCLAIKLNNFFSSILCLLATACFLFCIAESYLLMTFQNSDGFTVGTPQSRYVLAGEAQPYPQLIQTHQGLIPIKPKHPSGSYAHRDMYMDKPMFDVRYTFDDENQRILPPHSENFSAQLLLFGCSFTFGFGLENEETWVWKLANILGPQWKIDNYAFNAFGAHQMFAYLEDGIIRPPVAPFREALFFALHDHIRRFTGLFGMNSPWYEMENGEIVRKGFTDDSPYAITLKIPSVLNASQTAREISGWLNGIVMRKKEQEFKQIYTILIIKSAKLLKEKYNTPLTVLVWPNIEDIAPDLEKAGIPVIYARTMLVDWDTKGETVYHILMNREYHPNLKASGELAAGLGDYFIGLLKKHDSGLASGIGSAPGGSKRPVDIIAAELAANRLHLTKNLQVGE